MGHIFYPRYPKGKGWREVGAVFPGGADVPQIATAAGHAMTDGLETAALDPAFREAFWLLARLPRAAATAEDFAAAIRGHGLAVTDPPLLLDLTAAVSARIDDLRPKTDVNELAHGTMCETLFQELGPAAENLFGCTPAEVQRAVAGFDTQARFGKLARRFFARFAAKSLDFYLGREVGRFLGDGQRFRTLSAHADFRQALADHCHLAATIVEEFAGKWYSNNQYKSGGAIPRASANGFAEEVLTKLAKVLKREGTE